MLPAAINWPSSWSNAFSALLMKLTETHVVLQWSYLGIYQMQQYPLCYQQATQISSWALIRSWLAFITKTLRSPTLTTCRDFSLFLKRLLWHTCTEGSTYIFLLLFQAPVFDTMIIRFSRNTFLFFITTDKVWVERGKRLLLLSGWRLTCVESRRGDDKSNKQKAASYMNYLRFRTGSCELTSIYSG